MIVEYIVNAAWLLLFVGGALFAAYVLIFGALLGMIDDVKDRRYTKKTMKGLKQQYDSTRIDRTRQRIARLERELGIGDDK